MAEYTYNGAWQAQNDEGQGLSLANIAGAAVSLGLICAVGIWGYDVIARDVSGVPVVQALSGPMRIEAQEPGGMRIEHQGLAVNAITGQGGAEAPPEQVVLAPVPAGLSEEDLAQATLPLQARPTLASLPGREGPAMDDPVQALADQLASWRAPLEGGTPEGAEDDMADDDLDEETGPAPTRSLRPRQRPLDLLASARQAEVAPREVDLSALPAGTRLAQIGAFDSPDVARKEWARLEGVLGDYLMDKRRVIQRASSGGRIFYRLRAEGFADLSEARSFCAAFNARGVDCIPVVYQ